MGVHAVDRDGGLAGVLSPAPDRRHQPGPAGDGLPPDARVGEPCEQAPPIVDERHSPGGELPTMQVVCGESAPPPIGSSAPRTRFRRPSGPGQLPERQDPVVQVGDEDGVFVAGNALSGFPVRLDEAKQALAAVLPGDLHLAFQGTAQDGDATLAIPSGEPQLAILAFPSLSGVRPGRL